MAKNIHTFPVLQFILTEHPFGCVLERGGNPQVTLSFVVGVTIRVTESPRQEQFRLLSLYFLLRRQASAQERIFWLERDGQGFVRCKCWLEYALEISLLKVQYFINVFMDSQFKFRISISSNRFDFAINRKKPAECWNIKGNQSWLW